MLHEAACIREPTLLPAETNFSRDFFFQNNPNRGFAPTNDAKFLAIKRAPVLQLHHHHRGRGMQRSNCVIPRMQNPAGT